jgi:hypothetical protein
VSFVQLGSYALDRSRFRVAASRSGVEVVQLDAQLLTSVEVIEKSIECLAGFILVSLR